MATFRPESQSPGHISSRGKTCFALPVTRTKELFPSRELEFIMMVALRDYRSRNSTKSAGKCRRESRRVANLICTCSSRRLLSESASESARLNHCARDGSGRRGGPAESSDFKFKLHSAGNLNHWAGNGFSDSVFRAPIGEGPRELLGAGGHPEVTVSGDSLCQ
jgi:hypothetical protein